MEDLVEKYNTLKHESEKQLFKLLEELKQWQGCVESPLLDVSFNLNQLGFNESKRCEYVFNVKTTPDDL